MSIADVDFPEPGCPTNSEILPLGTPPYENQFMSGLENENLNDIGAFALLMRFSQSHSFSAFLMISANVDTFKPP
jgi:hypothetical protein